MDLKIDLKEDKRYLAVIRTLSAMRDPVITPFNLLRNREMEVYAILLYLYNDKYINIPIKERNTLIFSYEARQEITDKMKDISLDSVYNIMLDLRKKGFIDKRKLLITLPQVTKITLHFE